MLFQFLYILQPQKSNTLHLMTDYRFSENTFYLCHTGADLFRRSHLLLKTPESTTLRFPLTFEGNTLCCTLGDYADYRETIDPAEGGLVSRIRLKVKTDRPFQIHCPFLSDKPETPPYYMIPGFLYGTNNLKYGSGFEPKFVYGQKHGWPVSSAFSIRADRSTHNCVLSVNNSHVCLVAIGEKMEGISYTPDNPWQPAWAYNGLMLDTADPQTDMIGFQLGYENYPARHGHVWDDPRTPRSDEYLCGWIQDAAGHTLTTQAVYLVAPTSGIPDYGSALRYLYGQIHQPPEKRASRAETIEKMTDAVMQHGWNDTRKFVYLCDNDDGRDVSSNGWTGGMQIAWPMLLSATRYAQEIPMRRMISYINMLSGELINPKSGLFFEEFRNGAWHTDGWWGVRENCYNWGNKPLHSAYVNGQASYYLLKAWEHSGRKYAHWFDSARQVIDTALRGQRADGAYPRFFDPETGKAVDYNGFQSCWFLAGMALLARITRNESYRESALRAAWHYASWFGTGELYGSPMDTHEAVDEEGNLAYIDACAELHRLTNSADFLHLAQLGLDWEFSWKFPYNTAFSNDPLRRLNWSSSGGSVTSTHNVHIHPMGNLAAGSMHYLYSQTHDDYLASRLRDTCVWGLGTFNRFDGEFGFGATGMATEQFFHTDGLLLPWWRPWDGGVWEAFLPWSSGCILLSSAEEIPPWFYGEE